MKIKIQKIRSDDLKACAKILQLAYQKSPHWEKLSSGVAERYIKGKYRIGKDHSFVAIADNSKVVGFQFVSVSTWVSGPQAVFEELVVHPDWQGQGIGRQLMDFATSYLKKLQVKSAMLWAKKDDRLLRVYKKQGFRLASDFVVMFKDF